MGFSGRESMSIVDGGRRRAMEKHELLRNWKNPSAEMANLRWPNSRNGEIRRMGGDLGRG